MLTFVRNLRAYGRAIFQEILFHVAHVYGKNNLPDRCDNYILVSRNERKFSSNSTYSAVVLYPVVVLGSANAAEWKVFIDRKQDMQA